MGDTDILSDSVNSGEKKYIPYSERSGIALCLSGGGFRAAIFHLGALRRLNELGILSKVDTIVSVSGGSIISAHIADKGQWPELGAVIPNWERKIALPFRDFVKNDICTLPILKGILPWNWFRSGVQAKALAERYYKKLTKLTFPKLPEKPNHIFCATDLVFGVNWEMSRKRIGDWQAGYAEPPTDLPVALAVAASSCFPPLFRPLSLVNDIGKLKDGDFEPEELRDKLNSKMRLTDGGVYDNMGLEPVWKDHQVVLVSDGGAPFRFKESKTPLRQVQRYIEVTGKQSVSLRRRWLISSYIKNIMEGTYWGIASAPERYGPSYQGYSKKLAMDVISAIRTDMNRFSEAEISILENHGYLLAEAAIQEYQPSLISNPTELSIPHPDLMADEKVRTALKNSGKRITLKRFLGLVE